ncbi:hypothetical protein [Paraburkholderia fungorum]|uniref:hypothetical protein n=1 Tax=Paraburkholderia fungorum TaxID=134537 RepID=UPI00115F7820|nr:hypothetical protein [Paraburkholderia fungorum]
MTPVQKSAHKTHVITIFSPDQAKIASPVSQSSGHRERVSAREIAGHDGDESAFRRQHAPGEAAQREPCKRERGMPRSGQPFRITKKETEGDLCGACHR